MQKHREEVFIMRVSTVLTAVEVLKRSIYTELGEQREQVSQT